MKIAVLTSGGDAPGMNACIRAVVRTSIYLGIDVYGVRMGYNGLIADDMNKMNVSSVADIIHRGGTILGTARSDEFMTEEGQKIAAENLLKRGINGLVVIGGDGTLTGASKLLDKGINVVAIPATIDNDLGYTDYTIGFMTATETIVDAISKLRDTSSSHGRANVLEVMGRNCGDLALTAGLAGGAETIIVPEIPFDVDKMVEKAVSGIKRGKRHHIIVVAEGAASAYEISKELQNRAGIETRETVLGHVQRGGMPTVFDRLMASRMGNIAVKLLSNNRTNIALGLKCNEIVKLDIDSALKIPKRIDQEIFEIADILSI